MSREAGKGDDRRKEAQPGNYVSGFDAIDWSAHRVPIKPGQSFQFYEDVEGNRLMTALAEQPAKDGNDAG